MLELIALVFLGFMLGLFAGWQFGYARGYNERCHLLAIHQAERRADNMIWHERLERSERALELAQAQLELAEAEEDEIEEADAVQVMEHYHYHQVTTLGNVFHHQVEKKDETPLEESLKKFVNDKQQAASAFDTWSPVKPDGVKHNCKNGLVHPKDPHTT